MEASSIISEAVPGRSNDGGGYPPASVIKPTAPLHGFNPEQVQIAFEGIAGKAGQLRQFLLSLAGRMNDDSDGHADDVYLAITLVEGIGAIADRMTGNTIIGTYDHWLIGHHFEEAGRAQEGGTA